MSQDLARLVEYMARALVDNPDSVVVHDMVQGGTIVLELHVGKQDLGKVIGKNGATARAIRSVLFAASSRRRQRAVLNIIEE